MTKRSEIAAEAIEDVTAEEAMKRMEERSEYFNHIDFQERFGFDPRDGYSLDDPKRNGPGGSW